jgi:CRISPR/Cas system-associated exonuclease Cas4 (RecB family)
MSEYYKIPRQANWNYGGKNWKLSRSKIDLFMECPRCFYLDNKLGIKRPPGFPFNLNSAVDALLKKEFDIHRAKNKVHPLLKSYGVDLVPFQHEMMDEWRENFKGVRFEHEKTGLMITGAIDDVWVDKKGVLYVVDYKSTSKNEKIEALDQDWQIGYKRQMEIYQWLLRQNGFKVSDTGYFVYCNGITDKEAFDAKLEFEVTLIAYDGNDNWVEKAIIDADKCLKRKKIPKAGKDCDYCDYREGVKKVE